jgi:small subunit ribosomal protein S6
MPLYDLFLLLDPGAPSDRHDTILKEVKGLLDGGGKIVTDQEWGTRRMTFEIDHRPEADYHLLQFETEAGGALLNQVDHSLKIMDGVLRHRIIRLKDGSPAPPNPRPETRPYEEAPAEGAPVDGAPVEAAPVDEAAPAAEPVETAAPDASSLPPEESQAAEAPVEEAPAEAVPADEAPAPADAPDEAAAPADADDEEAAPPAAPAA